MLTNSICLNALDLIKDFFYIGNLHLIPFSFRFHKNSNRFFFLLVQLIFTALCYAQIKFKTQFFVVFTFTNLLFSQWKIYFCFVKFIFNIVLGKKNYKLFGATLFNWRRSTANNSIFFFFFFSRFGITSIQEQLRSFRLWQILWWIHAI